MEFSAAVTKQSLIFLAILCVIAIASISQGSLPASVNLRAKFEHSGFLFSLSSFNGHKNYLLHPKVKAKSPPKQQHKSPPPPVVHTGAAITSPAVQKRKYDSVGASTVGPQCGGVGQCCSNKQVSYPAGTPLMDSMWWSSQLAHGAKIQIREPTWNRWWVPYNNQTGWKTHMVQNSYQQPPVTQYFVVLRVSSNQIQLLTLGNSYITAANSDKVVGGGCCGTLATTTNGSDPGTIFNITAVPNRNFSVYIMAYDGYWISGDSYGWLLRWNNWGPSDWERHDILEVTQVPAIRGPNIGGWLVMEQWMTPSLYSNLMPYNDGTNIQFRSLATGKWISSGGRNSSLITCSGSGPETFYILRSLPSGGAFRFKTKWFQYWSMATSHNSKVYGNANTVGNNNQENFNLVFQYTNSSTVLILAPNGNYLRAASDGSLTADVAPSSVDRNRASTWNGQLAFLVKQVYSVNGEWQCANELGPDSATKVFNDFRNNFVVEADWKNLQATGANAVRLTVGWWVVDGSPATISPGERWPFPYNGTRYLDWAFQMAVKYNIRMFLSIHGAPGSQSGWGNTGTRAGTIEWPLPENVQATLTFIDWLCQRYVANAMFLGIGLLNEPLMSGVPNAVAQQYYMDAYDIVRSYSQCLFVATEARIGSNEWVDVIWLMTMPSYTNVMIDVHAYQTTGAVNSTTAREEIEWVKTVRLQQVVSLQETGRTLLVGEFSNAMNAGVVGQELQAAFSLAQIQTFSHAKNGWFFWSLKLNRSGYEHWSWFKSSQLGWLPKNPQTKHWF